MKVLQINSVCGTGSTGRIAVDIDTLLKEQGHESYIAYGRGSAVNCETGIRIGSDLDVYAHGAITRIFDRHGFGSKKATLDFIKEVEELDPDIIHLHNIHGYYINIEVLFDYLKSADKPVVWTLHDCWAFTGHCAHFDYVGCNKWVDGCYDCPQKNEYPSSLWLDKSSDNYSYKKHLFTNVSNMTIVTPSQWLAGLVQNSYLLKYPAKVINNGIDLNVFRPTQSNFRIKNGLEDKFIILGVANIWDKRKGYEYFLELSKYLQIDEVIILVGLSAKQMNKLPSNIIGISRTANIQELVEVYTAADIFFNPTLEDNFPTTNLEALACGIPVITFNTGGSIEAVDLSCGFVIEKRSIEKTYKVIKSFRERNDHSYSQSARHRAERLYDKNDRFNDYIELYASLI